jgi:hypothetical protein
MDLFPADPVSDDAAKPADGSVTPSVISETLSQSHTQLVPTSHVISPSPEYDLISTQQAQETLCAPPACSSPLLDSPTEPDLVSSNPSLKGKLSDEEFLNVFGVPKGPTPRVLRPRSGRSVLQASLQSTARVLAARLERLILAAKRIPRTRLNATVRQAMTLEDWPAWLEAIRKELHMLSHHRKLDPLETCPCPEFRSSTPH